jgi:AraC-like DNA-binding protein
MMITGIPMTEESVNNEQKIEDIEDYLVIEDGASDPYTAQPRRKYGEQTIKGIIVGQRENRRIIPIEQVRKLAALHLSYRDMAEFFGVKENTFRDNFRYEVERYRQVTKQRLMEAMMTNAFERMNPTVQIWMSKNILGWTDQPINTESSQVLPWLDEA